MDQGTLFPSAEARHLNAEELEAGLDTIRLSPRTDGILELIVCRPGEDRRRVLEEGQLDLAVGLMGDSWKDRRSSRTPDGSPDPETQINIMNSRVVALVAGPRERWPLAGDQLYIDLDLSLENAPAGTRLAIGDAILEVTPPPHRGCKKFVARFGLDAMKFVNSGVGKTLNLRGVNAKVVQPGTVCPGDKVIRL
jgi:hypothetical protein